MTENRPLTPIAFFVLSYFMKRANQRILESGINEIDEMSGRQFESFLRELFKKHRFVVKETAVVGDYGADLILEKSGHRLVVQAKRWKQNVGIKAVQEVIGAIKHYNAHRGVVISNSYFTDNAKSLARSNGIELWDRDKLIDFIRETKRIDAGKTIKNNKSSGGVNNI